MSACTGISVSIIEYRTGRFCGLAVRIRLLRPSDDKWRGERYAPAISLAHYRCLFRKMTIRSFGLGWSFEFLPSLL
jgi:hypothetical protein